MLEPDERRRLLRAPYQRSTPALFLDRDGVLIEDRHYLCDPNEVSLCPGSNKLLKIANQMGWAVVVITNQSGIARGYFDWSDYERVTDRLLCLLKTTAPVAESMPMATGLVHPRKAGANPAQPCCKKQVVSSILISRDHC